MSGDSLSAEDVYRETCSNIRATDDISFKLMGIVPLLSGATFLTFFLKGEAFAKAGPVVVALSLFAALVTLGLFRWELRNIQTCSWLIQRAKGLEKIVATEAQLPEKPKAPQGIGKTEAEQWIYAVTIIAWLCVPFLVVDFALLSWWVLIPYIVLAILILILTLLSAMTAVGRPGPSRIRWQIFGWAIERLRGLFAAAGWTSSRVSEDGSG
jgi:hypothetical protein